MTNSNAETVPDPARSAYDARKTGLTYAQRYDYYHHIALSIALTLDEGSAITSEMYAAVCLQARAYADGA